MATNQNKPEENLVPFSFIHAVVNIIRKFTKYQGFASVVVTIEICDNGQPETGHLLEESIVQLLNLIE